MLDGFNLDFSAESADLATARRKLAAHFDRVDLRVTRLEFYHLLTLDAAAWERGRADRLTELRARCARIEVRCSA